MHKHLHCLILHSSRHFSSLWGLDVSHLNEAPLLFCLCVNVWVKSTVSSMSNQPHLPPSTHPPISRAVESRRVTERLIKGPRTDLWRPFERTSTVTQVDTPVRALAQTHTQAQRHAYAHTHARTHTSACTEGHTNTKLQTHDGFKLQIQAMISPAHQTAQRAFPSHTPHTQMQTHTHTHPDAAKSKDRARLRDREREREDWRYNAVTYFYWTLALKGNTCAFLNVMGVLISQYPVD